MEAPTAVFTTVAVFPDPTLIDFSWAVKQQAGQPPLVRGVL